MVIPGNPAIRAEGKDSSIYLNGTIDGLIISIIPKGGQSFPLWSYTFISASINPMANDCWYTQKKFSLTQLTWGFTRLQRFSLKIGLKFLFCLHLNCYFRSVSVKTVIFFQGTKSSIFLTSCINTLRHKVKLDWSLLCYWHFSNRKHYLIDGKWL